MSKPVFSDLFKATGRRNRKSFLLYSLAWWLLLFYAFQIVIRLPPAIGGLTVLVVGVGLIWSKVAVTVQRINDLSVPKAIWAGLFLPFVGRILEFVLLVMPEDIGSNRFGDDPLLVAPQ